MNMNMNTTAKAGLYRKLAGIALAAVLVTGGIAAGIQSERGGKSEATRPIVNFKEDHTAPERGEQLALSFASVVRQVTPSVVQVTVSKTVQQAGWQPGAMPGPDLFEWFFGQRPGMRPGAPAPNRLPRQQGVGSGVIVSEDGYLLTNNHVVDGADEVLVRLSDQRELKAKVVGRDPQTDLAVMKVQASGLPALTMADSEQVEVGDIVLAVGNPFGIGQTVTMGIVSATGRGNLGLDYEDFIQTDAAINPGNSGGALVDSHGRLIGINTAILSRTGGNNGIGFAVPTSLARYVMEDLVKDGEVRRGFLGVAIQDLTPALAKKLELDAQGGALVADVNPGTPAAKAGLKSGDVITELDGKAIRDGRQLRLLVARTEPGAAVSLKALRNGKEKRFSVTLNELPRKASLARGGDRGSGNTEALQGVAVQDLDARTRRQMNVPADLSGALITEVASGSAAERAGLRAGDVIVEINREPVSSAEDAVNLTTNPKDPVTLLRVWRDGSTRFVVVDESEPG
jgi:serine protease Do